jgi:hypothetical protein
MSLFDHSVFDDVPSKRCARCGIRKPVDAFYRVKRNPDGRCHFCRECKSKESSGRREKDHEKHLYKERRSRLRDKYNLTHKQYNDMVTAQSNLCAICGKPPSGQRANHGVLNVDHSHTHGYVRSLLCDLCNKMLGQCGDDPEILLKAAAYLKKHAALNE